MSSDRVVGERGKDGTAGVPRTSVLIAGSGVAALEAVLALRSLAGARVSISLLSPDDELLYRPVTVAEAFGRGEAHSFRIDEVLADQGVEHRHDSLARVNPDAHTVLTGAGDELPYDKLVIATGARAEATLPGALTFGGRDDVPALRALLDELVDGTAHSVVFAVRNPHAWALPLYELALMTAAHLRDHDCPARVTLATPEATPLELFGADAEQVIRPMLDALGVVLRCSVKPSAVRRRELMFAGGGGVMADRVVTLPELRGPAIEGLPADPAGFIPVDGHGQVRGLSDVFAAGDVTEFPLKQGGLATQQADAVAEVIAKAAGAPVTPRRFSPVLRGLLITAGAPMYLRCEPQRLQRRSSVAIDDHRVSRARAAGASVASDQALWWPPAKVAGRYLAPYLATARPLALALAPESFTDRSPVPGPATPEAEFDDAVELMLLLADGDAKWGDYEAALSALNAAETLQGTLPPEYEAKRRLWLAELRGS